LVSPLSATAGLAGENPTPLRVCATVPDLGALVREVGGDEVSVTIFAKGREDAHFVEAKPSFIKSLSQADIYISVGLDLEIGWAPVLLQNARNSRILIGSQGFLDASTAVTPVEIPSGQVDRSRGDIHPFGNPHYLLDPLNGLRVAALIRDKLGELRPDRKPYFEKRYAGFQRRLGEALGGEALAAKYDPETIASLAEESRLDSAAQGWLGMMLPYRGVRVVSDHNIWPYFARRFGLSVRGFLEPKPGLSPTTKHLQSLIEQMRAEGTGLILTVPYFDPRHAQFISANTKARIVPLAHQVGALPGTEEYLRLIDYNVRQIVEALKGEALP
jgi:ABC-type Zn uptake system ZnuABC Zn-binding protein ZnuA